MTAPNTFGLCKKCLELRPAVRHDNGISVFISTYCPTHGVQVGVREPSLEFYRQLRAATDFEYVVHRRGSTCINVTDACNMRCQKCYHRPTRGHYPLEDILAVARRVTRPDLVLLGAEPTTREDLPEVVARVKETTGKNIGVHTNGLLAAAPGYLEILKHAGLGYVMISVNTERYHTEEEHEKKRAAVTRAKEAGLNVGVAFNLLGLDEVAEALDIALALDLPDAHYVRMRVVGAVGSDEGSGIHLSGLVAAFRAALEARGLVGEVQKGSHPYMVLVKVKNRLIYLVRWPAIEELDFYDLALCPARGLLVPELGETPMLHQCHVFAQRRLKEV